MRTYHVMPAPTSLIEGQGRYLLGENAVVRTGSALTQAQQAELEGLFSRFMLRAGRVEVRMDAKLAPCEAVWGEGACVELNAEDEYALKISEAGGCIRAKDGRGLLHGLFTLLQLIEPAQPTGKLAFCAPAVEIHDHPAMKMRAIHLCLFPENTLLLMEKAIRLAGVLKYTHVIIEFWGTLRYDVMKELAWPEHSWEKSEIRALVDLAHRMGLEMIPMFNHLGHATQSRVAHGRHVTLDQNPSLARLFEPDGWTWCLSNPETHELLRAVREELMELCGPGEYFHLGCDEAYSYASCPVCSEKDGPKMLADYLNGLTGELAEKGRRPMIWADALMDSAAWEPPTIATSRPDQKTHLALPLLDRRIIMADWQYNISTPEVPSAEYFMREGFDVTLCPWDGRNNIRSLAEAADRQGALGLMVTTWHHLTEMLRILDVGAEYAWNGTRSQANLIVTGTAALLRKVMPELPSFEDAGFIRHEVPHPDRYMMKKSTQES